MTKFKLGDRVRAIKGDGNLFRARDVGTVCEIPTWYGADCVQVKFDTPRLRGGYWYVKESNLERETEQ